jgi:hypothetical protein
MGFLVVLNKMNIGCMEMNTSQMHGKVMIETLPSNHRFTLCSLEP